MDQLQQNTGKKTGAARMWLHYALGSVPIWTLALAVAAFHLIPHAIESLEAARQAARLAMCESKLSLHIGAHAVDVVEIDRQFQLIRAGSCPDCSDLTMEPVFRVIGNDGEFVEALRAAEVPTRTFEEAREWLKQLKAEPHYQALRNHGMGRGSLVWLVEHRRVPEELRWETELDPNDD